MPAHALRRNGDTIHHGQISSERRPFRSVNVFGPSIAATTVQVLKQCGDDLTRENVMRQAANLHHLELPMLLPGITINTSLTDFAPIKQVQMERFDGKHFIRFGPILSGTIT